MASSFTFRSVSDVRGKGWGKVLDSTDIRCYANSRSHAILAMTLCVLSFCSYIIYIGTENSVVYIKFL